MEEAYLVLDDLGNLVQATDDPDEAAAVASAKGPWFWAGGTGAEAMEQNPPLGPRRALELAQLSPVSHDEVMAISEKEAHARLLPIFEEYRKLSGRGSLRWADWTAPLSGLLGDNTKLHKADPTKPPAVALGVSLLPEHGAFRWQTKGGVDFAKLKSKKKRFGPQPPVEQPYFGWQTRPEQATLCAGASEFCKQFCLVNAGQNQSDVRNNMIKRARAKALLSDPPAFLRLLVAALAKYATGKSKKLGGRDTIRFCRLNVFQDIPWEELCPWLFDPESGASSGILFYDYTKVPNRPFLPTYDLSFSYSGTNERFCSEELARGRRIVMVFVDPENYARPQTFGHRLKYLAERKGITLDQKRKEKAAKKLWLKKVPLPTAFRGPKILGGRWLNVIDGDVSDIRPFDPMGVVVGLRFKPPQFKGSGFHNAPKRFVVRGEVVESDRGRVFKLTETPLARPAPTTGV